MNLEICSHQVMPVVTNIFGLQKLDPIKFSDIKKFIFPIQQWPHPKNKYSRDIKKKIVT